MRAFTAFICAFIFILCFANSALACKLTPLGGSSLMMNAVIEHIESAYENPADMTDRISRMDIQDFNARVQILSETGNCRVERYAVEIAPNCWVRVAPIVNKKPESCL